MLLYLLLYIKGKLFFLKMLNCKFKICNWEHIFRNVQIRDTFYLRSLRCKCFYMFFSVLPPHEGQLSGMVVIRLICMFCRGLRGFSLGTQFSFCRLKTHMGRLRVFTPRCINGWCVCSLDK